METWEKIAFSFIPRTNLSIAIRTCLVKPQTLPMCSIGSISVCASLTLGAVMEFSRRDIVVETITLHLGQDTTRVIKSLTFIL